MAGEKGGSPAPAPASATGPKPKESLNKFEAALQARYGERGEKALAARRVSVDEKAVKLQAGIIASELAEKYAADEQAKKREDDLAKREERTIEKFLKKSDFDSIEEYAESKGISVKDAEKEIIDMAIERDNSKNFLAKKSTALWNKAKEIIKSDAKFGTIGAAVSGIAIGLGAPAIFGAAATTLIPAIAKTIKTHGQRKMAKDNQEILQDIIKEYGSLESASVAAQEITRIRQEIGGQKLSDENKEAIKKAVKEAGEKGDFKKNDILKLVEAREAFDDNGEKHKNKEETEEDKEVRKALSEYMHTVAFAGNKNKEAIKDAKKSLDDALKGIAKTYHSNEKDFTTNNYKEIADRITEDFRGVFAGKGKKKNEDAIRAIDDFMKEHLDIKTSKVGEEIIVGGSTLSQENRTLIRNGVIAASAVGIGSQIIKTLIRREARQQANSAIDPTVALEKAGAAIAVTAATTLIFGTLNTLSEKKREDAKQVYNSEDKGARRNIWEATDELKSFLDEKGNLKDDADQEQAIELLADIHARLGIKHNKKLDLFTYGEKDSDGGAVDSIAKSARAMTDLLVAKKKLLDKLSEKYDDISELDEKINQKAIRSSRDMIKEHKELRGGLKDAVKANLKSAVRSGLISGVFAFGTALANPIIRSHLAELKAKLSPVTDADPSGMQPNSVGSATGAIEDDPADRVNWNPRSLSETGNGAGTAAAAAAGVGAGAVIGVNGASPEDMGAINDDLVDRGYDWKPTTVTINSGASIIDLDGDGDFELVDGSGNIIEENIEIDPATGFPSNLEEINARMGTNLHITSVETTKLVEGRMDVPAEIYMKDPLNSDYVASYGSEVFQDPGGVSFGHPILYEDVGYQIPIYGDVPEGTQFFVNVGTGNEVLVAEIRDGYAILPVNSAIFDTINENGEYTGNWVGFGKINEEGVLARFQSINATKPFDGRFNAVGQVEQAVTGYNLMNGDEIISEYDVPDTTFDVVETSNGETIELKMVHGGYNPAESPYFNKAPGTPPQYFGGPLPDESPIAAFNQWSMNVQKSPDQLAWTAASLGSFQNNQELEELYTRCLGENWRENLGISGAVDTEAEINLIADKIATNPELCDGTRRIFLDTIAQKLNGGSVIFSEIPEGTTYKTHNEYLFGDATGSIIRSSIGGSSGLGFVMRDSNGKIIYDENILRSLHRVPEDEVIKIVYNRGGCGGQQSMTTERTPEITTPPPVFTTQPPVITTPPPVFTTQPPVITTPPPVITTPPPVETTPPPVITTPPPVETTPPPVETTPPPVVTTPPPVETTPPPVITTPPPVETTPPPVVTTPPPVITTPPPVETTPPPVVTTPPPVITTPPPDIPKDSENLQNIDEVTNNENAEDINAGEIEFEVVEPVSDSDLTEQPQSDAYQGTEPTIIPNEAATQSSSTIEPTQSTTEPVQPIAEPIQEQISPENNYSENLGGANADHAAENPVQADQIIQEAAKDAMIPLDEAPVDGAELDDIFGDLGL